jgi:putative phosphoribosyl transferase
LPRRVIKFPISNSISDMYIEGDLVIPENPIGIVVFAHGSGSSKSSKRNQLVSEKLNKSNIATLLFDLLTIEEQTFDTQLEKMSLKIPGAILNKFNISLLTNRLSMVTDWVMSNPSIRKLPMSFFASSTGGAAALISASRYNIVSIVIRSGRTDLIENKFLENIESSCLFIVGSKEKSLISINKDTIKKIRNSKEKKLCIIKGASHLFKEEGSMEEVGEVTTHWMTHNFILGNNSDRMDW